MEGAQAAQAVWEVSSRAEVTVVCQTARHSELAEESRSRQQAALMNRARFLGKLGMTFFFVRLLMHGHLPLLWQAAVNKKSSNRGNRFMSKTALRELNGYAFGTPGALGTENARQGRIWPAQCAELEVLPCLFKQSCRSNRSLPNSSSFRACRGISLTPAGGADKPGEIPRQARNDVLFYSITCARLLNNTLLSGPTARAENAPAGWY